MLELKGLGEGKTNSPGSPSSVLMVCREDDAGLPSFLRSGMMKEPTTQAFRIRHPKSFLRTISSRRPSSRSSQI